MTCNYQPLLLPRPSVDNLRDLGGRPGHQGRPLKRGLLFRSAELSCCTPEDKAFLEELGIRLVVDFRDLDEREARPDRLPAGALYRHLPALPLDWAYQDVPYAPMLARLFRTDLFRFFLTFYRILANSEETAAAYAEFFRLLLAGEGPVLWHCTQGKDRAGVAAILLHTALGVDWEGCLEDYFLTNEMILPVLQPQLDACRDPEDVRQLKLLNLVQRDCIEGWREQLDRKWGGLEAYLHAGLGLTAADLDRLRELYLD